MNFLIYDFRFCFFSLRPLHETLRSAGIRDLICENLRERFFVIMFEVPNKPIRSAICG